MPAHPLRPANAARRATGPSRRLGLRKVIAIIDKDESGASQFVGHVIKTSLDRVPLLVGEPDVVTRIEQVQLAQQRSEYFVADSILVTKLDGSRTFRIPEILRKLFELILLPGIQTVLALATFIATRTVVWEPGAILMVGAVCGGFAGASVARRLDRSSVRLFVSVVGWIITIYFFSRRP